MKPLVFVILTLLWMLLIYHFSSLPSASTGPDTPFFKVISKVLHFFNFGILSVLYLFSLKWKKSLLETGARIFILSLIFTVLYAIMDENHQSFSPGRSPSIKDILLDTSGALTFLSIIYILRQHGNNK